MCSYSKTQVSPYDPTKFAIHSILRSEDYLISNFSQNFKKTVSFDGIVQFMDEEDIVTCEDFDCGFFSTLKLLQKSGRATQNGITFPDSAKNQSTFPATIGITVLLMRSITLISF